MPRKPTPPQRDLAVLLGLLLLLLFASPLADWWARPPVPWYAPYVLWALVVALSALLASRGGRDGP